MIDKFYEEELRYLYDSGREFAKAHPDRARFLNIDAVGDRDPYVERLFEGFAFLSGRIREKLDDSFPELTEGMLSLLWPQFLQEIPACAIGEFRPRKGMIMESRTILRGTEILSAPAGSEGAICRFTTSHDCTIHPVSLAGINKVVDTQQRATLTLRFSVDGLVNFSALKLDPLRLYFHAELPSAHMLHEFFTQRVAGVTISLNNGQHSFPVPLPTAITPGGLTAQESLLPTVNRSFWGYGLLREYFVFPEKFLSADLHGFSVIPSTITDVTSIEYAITFDTDFPPDKPFSANNLRLYCVPIVNIFKREAEPINNTGLNAEYMVLADVTYPSSFLVHQVLSVTGIDRLSGNRTVYEPFHSFKNLGRTDRRTYAVSHRTAFNGKRYAYLSIGGKQLTENEIREESLTLEVYCTNGGLPREELREGSISNPGPGFPDFTAVGNITRPTLNCKPPELTEYQWSFLGHLGASYASLADAETLKALLRLYDWSGAEGRSRRIESITDVSQKSIDCVRNGSVLRGVEFSVSVQEADFKDTSDLHLFGQILITFLSHYVSINSFVELALQSLPTGSVRRFSSIKGEQWLL